MNRTESLSYLAELSSRAQDGRDKRSLFVEDQPTARDELRQIHSYPTDAAASVVGVSRNKFRQLADQAVAEGLMPPPSKPMNAWLYDLEQLHVLLRLNGVPSFHERHPNADPLVLDVQNLKGGVGKTMTASHIAVGLASTRIRERYRICLIDCDPQGSQRLFLAPTLANRSAETILSAVDVMLGEGDCETLEDAGVSLRDILLSNAVLQTHIPNLSLIASWPEDARYNHRAYTGNSIEMSKLLRERVIDPLRDDFDIFILDTGPHIDPMVWAAMYAANAMLVPCPAKELDWHSTRFYLESLSNIYSRLPPEWPGMRFMRVLPTMFEQTSHRQTEILRKMFSSLRTEIMTSHVVRSAAFETCAKTNRTVFDVNTKDFQGTRETLDRALRSISDVLTELEAVMLTSWPQLASNEASK